VYLVLYGRGGLAVSKYENLTVHLVEATPGESPLTLTFKQIEKIIGSQLPDSARRYQAWWANQSGKGHSQAYSWACAGWRTSDLDLENETVTFRYVAEEMARANFERQKANAVRSEGISVEEAKSRLAITFNVSPGNVEIVVRV
jgi:hypothetical protein